MMYCHACGKQLKDAFFSVFVYHYIELPDNAEVPVFCDEHCMMDYLGKIIGDEDISNEWDQYTTKQEV